VHRDDLSQPRRQRPYSPSHPISFKRKIKFLRLAFRRLNALKPFDDDAQPLFTKALALSGDRNDLMHGALTSLTPINGKWHMAIFDYETPKDQAHWHVSREFTFSPEKFQELESQLVPLSGQVVALGRRLFATLP
jgi:hypothetical protein